MPEAIKLYHAPASPNSRRVRMFLAEKGISLPLVSVDLAAGEQHGDAYRAINPRRVVPTLVLEDGTAIGEVLAIWRYLEEAYPATPRRVHFWRLRGRGIMSVAQVELLRAAVHDRKNLLVAGGTFTVKTTLLNAILAGSREDRRLHRPDRGNTRTDSTPRRRPDQRWPDTISPKRSLFWCGGERQYCGGAVTVAPSSAAACHGQRGS
jgi:Glutathione S-transferase, N-terminal domain